MLGPVNFEMKTKWKNAYFFFDVAKPFYNVLRVSPLIYIHIYRVKNACVLSRDLYILC